MSAPVIGGSENNFDNPVEKLSCQRTPRTGSPPVEDLAFSGSYNSAVGMAVDPSTPTVNSTAGGYGTYGTYMTLEGTIQITNGQYIYIAHDEEVSLLDRWRQDTEF